MTVEMVGRGGWNPPRPGDEPLGTENDMANVTEPTADRKPAKRKGRAYGPTGKPAKPNTVHVVLLITDRNGEQKLYAVAPLFGPNEHWNGVWVLTVGDRKYHLVDEPESGWACDCPGYRYSKYPKSPCKHIRAFKAARNALCMAAPVCRPAGPAAAAAA